MYKKCWKKAMHSTKKEKEPSGTYLYSLSLTYTQKWAVLTLTSRALKRKIFYNILWFPVCVLDLHIIQRGTKTHIPLFPVCYRCFFPVLPTRTWTLHYVPPYTFVLVSHPLTTETQQASEQHKWSNDKTNNTL